MEPLRDDELNRVLREWRAPAAPANLEARIFANAPEPWWRWLLTGSIRVPAPVCAMLVIVVLGLAIFSARRQRADTAEGAGFAGFQPVTELKPRIIRSVYEKP